MLRQFVGSEERDDIDPTRYDGFGNAIASAGDVNGDRRSDIIVLAPASKNWTGYASVYSGLDGTRLLSLNGERERAHSLAGRVGTVGDIDRDGCDDVFVECGNGDWTLVYSGKTGMKLFTSSDASTPFAWTVLDSIHRFVGDLDRDGKDDWLESTKDDVLRVKSGRDDKTLLTFDANLPAPWRFDRAGAAGDINGDGVPDLWICSDIGTEAAAKIAESRAESAPRKDSRAPRESRPASNSHPVRRRLRIVSGIDGSELQRVESPWWELARYGVAGVGDLDGDGRGELVIGFHESNYLGTCGGSVFVLSFPASKR
jgi:hypothetical protein